MNTKTKRRNHAQGDKAAAVANLPAFGIWADREDMKDVHAWLEKIRTPRYLRDGGSLSSPPAQESKCSPKS
jgi:hypothetical protein